MSSINIAVKTLLATPAVTDIVGDRIHPMAPPQNARMPFIVVYLISETEEDMVSGASQLRDGRVSIESRCADVPQLSILGEAVIDAMRDRIEFPIANCVVTTRKASTDESDYGKQTGPSGDAIVYRRITDFYCFWRRGS